MVFRNALGRATRWNLVARTVAEPADPPRVPRFERRLLTIDEARGFLAAANGHRLEALCSVALSLGLRQGEALGLRWADVDLDAKTLRVSHGLERVPRKGLQLVEPKTKTSLRTLVLPDTVVRSLRAHRARQLEERLAAGDRWQDLGFVFATYEGRPLAAGHLTHGTAAGTAPGRRGLSVRFASVPVSAICSSTISVFQRRRSCSRRPSRSVS